MYRETKFKKDKYYLLAMKDPADAPYDVYVIFRRGKDVFYSKRGSAPYEFMLDLGDKADYYEDRFFANPAKDEWWVILGECEADGTVII